MLTLNTIRAKKGATHRTKRLGRGQGSGHGQTAGKGDKGQLARSGGHSRPGFEGGQMPLYRRIPKRGFFNPGVRDIVSFNLRDLAKVKSKEVTLETLSKEGFIPHEGVDRLVILSMGDAPSGMTVKAHRVSAQAKEKIEKAGGKVELIKVPGRQKKGQKKVRK